MNISFSSVVPFETVRIYIHHIQGERKFFPLLQIFITRKPRGIQTGAHVEVY